MNLAEGIKMNCLNIEREYVLAKALLSGLKTADFRRSVIQVTQDEVKQLAQRLVEFDSNFMQ